MTFSFNECFFSLYLCCQQNAPAFLFVREEKTRISNTAVWVAWIHEMEVAKFSGLVRYQQYGAFDDLNQVWERNTRVQ